ncbi:hypothetical protein TNCV_26291 [Trichonephila clavipes]|uniref:Uncharacterized protein n=1 Tax=Trichonephila clavipes TaxID=2585209 RepID=A0A8X7BDG6_TRICX|nr:hypothetical protein TNCV_26291 [Trichonephila clavipes]
MFEPITAEDPLCGGEMPFKSIENSNVLPLMWRESEWEVCPVLRYGEKPNGSSGSLPTESWPCDEAHFWLNGYVNKQNCRIWSEANPQVYVETPLHPEKLTVWCALWASGTLLQKR